MALRQKSKVSLVQRSYPPKNEPQESYEDQASSMIEEVEIGGAASCVTGCSQDDISTKEFDGKDITQEPMIQKAIELFEANKITVQSKI
jgi:DNA polymerase III subunit gamma/tau